MFINHNIKHLVKTKFRNRSAFADEFGITPTAVAKYEKNLALPRLDLVVKIADRFELSLSEIVLSDITLLDKNKKANKSTKKESELIAEKDRRIKELTETIEYQRNLIDKLLPANSRTG
ncbi:helix-turn-helix domain-containing protein [Nonlabens sp. SY33080]|uniref:helix-turn-helix domain-containing protein n=1 Tax=Nonlabens sp. SY33080 TaxID=2719911 RepID=UPI001428C559|nr:helix-turn-helix transcriptional regulator [Nonlabens sp. SY33080]